MGFGLGWRQERWTQWTSFNYFTQQIVDEEYIWEVYGKNKGEWVAKIKSSL
jgi:hypothetical protein